MELHALLLFLMNVAWIRGAVVFMFHDDVRDNAANMDVYTPAERECFQQGQLLHEADGKCYHLLEFGPCSDGEKYVLDRKAVDNGKVRAVCKKLPCDDNAPIFWPEDEKCHRHRDSRILCPLQETLLDMNLLGEWECLCKKNPPHIHWEVELAHRPGDERVKCYQLYGRGEPCKAGFIFVATDVGFSGKCVRDPCGRHNTGSGTFAEWSNGTCYELGARGPCPSGQQFMLHAETMRPECYSIGLAAVELGAKCEEDASGRCPDVVTVQDADRYVRNILNQVGRSPKRGAAPTSRGISSQSEGVVRPQSEVVTTQSEVVTTQSEVVTTQSEVVTTQSEVVTTQSEVVTTQSEVVTTQSEVVTTQSEGVTPKSKKVTPQSQKVTPKSQKVTLKSKRVTPQSEEVTPKSQSVTPQGKEVTSQKPEPTMISANSSTNMAAQVGISKHLYFHVLAVILSFWL